MKRKNGPWTITSSKQVYKNPWLTVREDRIIRLDGQPGMFGVAAIKEGSLVVAMDRERNVYLGKQSKYALGHESIEGFGGGIEPGDTPLQTARRELHEEGGLISDHWTSLGTVEPVTSSMSCTSNLFLAENVRVVERKLDGNELIEVLKVPLSEAMAMAHDGRICHAATIVIILKAHLLLNARSAESRRVAVS